MSGPTLPYSPGPNQPAPNSPSPNYPGTLPPGPSLQELPTAGGATASHAQPATATNNSVGIVACICGVLGIPAAFTVTSLDVTLAPLGVLAVIVLGVLAIALSRVSLVRIGRVAPGQPGRPSRVPATVGLICGILVTLAGLYFALSYVLFFAAM